MNSELSGEIFEQFRKQIEKIEVVQKTVISLIDQVQLNLTVEIVTNLLRSECDLLKQIFKTSN